MNHRNQGILVATFAILLVLDSVPARADVVIGFTNAIDFNYVDGTKSISDLAATATFHADNSTHQLTITLDNESTTAKIAGLYFNGGSSNSFSNVQVSSSESGLSATFPSNTNADGFGRFGYHLDFGSGQNSLMNTSTTATITATYTGTISDAQLAAATHSNTYGDNAGVLDWRPPTADHTGFGGGTASVPEPSSFILVAACLPVGLMVWRSRRQSAHPA